jgi:hypothetical protein
MRRELIFKRQTHEKRAHTLSSNVFVSWIWALFSCVCLLSMSSLLMCLSLE